MAALQLSSLYHFDLLYGDEMAFDRRGTRARALSGGGKGGGGRHGVLQGRLGHTQQSATLKRCRAGLTGTRLPGDQSGHRSPGGDAEEKPGEGVAGGETGEQGGKHNST